VKSPRWIQLSLIGAATAALLSGCGSSASPTDPGAGLDTTPPPAPANLVLTTDNEGRSVLRWDPSAAADLSHYQVYVYDPAPGSGSSYVPVGDPNLTDNTYTMPDVSSDVTVTYRVKAVDISGNQSAMSAAFDITLTSGSGGDPTTPIDVY
jgi:uncharacterized protein YceK